MTQGLLFVLSEPRPDDEAEFHDWYDNEHGPARMALPGIRTGHRYRAADGAAPGWLASYELDLDVLATAEYRRLRERRSARETALMARLAVLDRRIYEFLDDHGAAGDGDAPAAPVLVVRSITVDPPHDRNFHAWYTDEHIPALHRIPGWHRTRRYELREGQAPRFLALHEISDVGLFDTDLYRAATDTAWRSEVMRHATRNERRVFSFHRSFHRSLHRSSHATPPSDAARDEAGRDRSGRS